jgi:SAM-dependent methyltransferase
MTTLARLDALNGAKNFNDAVFRKVAPFIGTDVLEVGMGIGIFTERILERARTVVGVDIVPEFLDIAREKFRGRPAVEIHQADMGAGIPPFLAGRTFDTIVCMNVLEHIERDDRAVRDFLTLLAPGGRLVLVVPQYPWLYNTLDSNDGHFRRYREAGLRRLLLDAGFDVVHESRFNLAGILGWFVNGSLLRRRELPTGQLGLYDRLIPWLFLLESWSGPPAGLSLMMVGRRPDGKNGPG